MRSWPGRHNSTRGKQSRIRMLKEILADSGGKIKYDELKKQLQLRGYHFLIEKLQPMGFTVDDEGYVHARVS